MANYCSADDIMVALGYTDSFSASTRPTLTQVNTIISNITNELDLYLNMIGIASQPTDTRMLGKLKEACTLGSSARVGFGYIDIHGGLDNTLPKIYWDRYNELLKEIKENPEIFGITGGGTTFITSNVIDGTYTESETKALFQEMEYKP